MKKSFTLIEMMITVVVIGVLATVATVGYNQFLEMARQRVCETNLTILNMAIKAYATRNDAFPATLSELEPADVSWAYAKVIKNNGLLAKVSYAFVQLNSPKEAYAAGYSEVVHLSHLMDPAIMRRYGVDPKVFKCPGDSSGRPSSYGIRSELIDIAPVLHSSWRAWSRDPLNRPKSLIGDCDNPTFTDESQLAYRHTVNFGTERMAQAITVGEVIRRHNRQAANHDNQGETS